MYSPALGKMDLCESTSQCEHQYWRITVGHCSYDLKSTQKINKSILFGGKDAENSAALAMNLGKDYF